MKRPIFFSIIMDLKFRYYDDDVPALGAQVAYSLLLSFFPFLIFLMTLVGYSPISDAQILEAFSRILPERALDIVKELVLQVNQYRDTKLLSIGLLSTLWAASNGVGAIMRGLNKAYDEKETRPFWMVKGISILFTMALSLIILFSFLLLIFGQQIGAYIASLLNLESVFHRSWNILRYLTMLSMMFLVFSALYCCTPNRKIALKEVIPGAVCATTGWILISLGFSTYVNNFGLYPNVYGSIGGIFVLLVWLFLSSMIILLGGELNASLIHNRVRSS